MANLGWKRFKFFDEARFEDSPLPDSVTASCPGGDGDVWLGCGDGLVVCLDRGLAVKATFPAYQGRVHTIQVDKGKLITVGDDGEGLKALTLKAWEVAALRAGVTPPTAAAAKLFAAGKPPEGGVGAVAVCAQQWPAVTVAVALSTGLVVLIKGDAVKGKLPAPFARHQLRAGGGANALHFAGGAADRHVFAVSTAAVAALSARTGRAVLEEECGAAAGCSAVTPAGELLLAGPDAVHFFSAEEGRKAAFAVQGDKRAVAAFKQYMVAVVPDDAPAASAAAAPPLVLRVFDLANKVVAGSSPLAGEPRWLVADAAGATAADAAGAAVRLRERPLADRLDSLYRSRSFQLALSVARGEGAPAAALAEVHRHFGDFLYGKRDYDGAAQQYGATVGELEPSYPIQRFLDAQRIHNLTFYLEALHAAGLAGADHTTLLLNCYTKLRDVAKLDAFVEGAGAGGAGGAFDPGAAVKVLRAAGYHDHALRVAAAAGERGLYLDVLVEDCGRHEEALEYVRGLGRPAAAAALLRYGKALLGAAPVAATALLMELCLPPAGPGGGAGGGGGANGRTRAAGTSGPSTRQDDESSQLLFVANLADFTHLYADRPDDLRYACVTILGLSRPDLPSRQALYHTLLDLHLGGGSINGGGGGGGGEGEGRSDGSGEERWRPVSRAGGEAGRAEALELLRRGWVPGEAPAYDADRALTVCRRRAFPEGLVFLYGRLRRHREAAAVLAAARDWEGLLAACDAHGDAAAGGDPALWHDALAALAAPGAGAGAEAALRALLARIEASGALPLLAVLPVLARNPSLRLDLVKGHVARALAAENRAIRADQEEAEALAAEAERARAATARLLTEPTVFQASRDAQTNAPLELPSVHFLCGHSFNARTLGDGEGRQCPLCAAEHARVAELQRSRRGAAGGAAADAFFRQLKAAGPDSFGLVAEWYSKGLLNNTSVTQQGPG